MDNISDILKKQVLSQSITVDKPVDKPKYAVKTATKPKILKINLNQGFSEGNLTEMPLVLYYDKKKKDIVTVVEYTWTDSDGIQRGVEIRGSGKYGVPAPFEFDVLLALLRIYGQNKKILLYQEDMNDDDISEEDITICFTLTQVAKELGLEKPNAPTLNKILRAIEILTDTTIYNRCAGGIYDIHKKKYIEDQSVAFHIIEKFESTLYRNSTKRNRGQDVQQRVKLNKFFYRSITGNYFKLYDHTDYVAINTSVGRKLFLIFNKWRNNKHFLKIKCETLYQRIPLDAAIPVRKKNQTIKRALDSLKEIEFITEFEMKNNMVTVYFKQPELLLDESCDHTYFKDRYNAMSDIVKKFEQMGFDKNEVSNHMSTIVFDMEYTKALLRYADMQDYYQHVDDLKAFVMAGLMKKYNIDTKYYN